VVGNWLTSRWPIEIPKASTTIGLSSTSVGGQASIKLLDLTNKVDSEYNVRRCQRRTFGVVLFVDKRVVK